MNILQWGDPHLNSRNDLKKYAGIERDLGDIDLSVVVGDVIDPIPRDREDRGKREEHLDLGKTFFDILNQAGERNDFNTVFVPGNHDHDILEEAGRDLENVYNIHRNYTTGEVLGLDRDIAFVGLGADSFDLHPEVRPTDYDSLDPSNSDSFSPEHYEAELRAFSNTEKCYDDLVKEFDIGVGDRAKFKDQLDDYVENYVDLGQKQDRDLAFITHIAPFNTNNDFKQVNEIDQVCHYGSVALKNAILDYGPEMVLHGHNNEEMTFDYIDGPEGETYVLDTGEGNLANVGLSEDGSFSYREL